MPDRNNMSRLDLGEHDVLLNGVNIHYTVRGKGPVLIAISGGPGFDARCWDNFGRVDDFTTIVAIHPRGSGLSGPAPRDIDYALPQYAADVEALRVHLGLDRPMVMGWSHGGLVAQQFAFTYPDSLSKLILLDTAAHFGEIVSDIDSIVMRFRDEPWFERSLAALKKETACDYRTEEELAALWAEEMKFYFRAIDLRIEAYCERAGYFPIRTAPLKYFNSMELPFLDLRPRLKDIRVPTLVLVGRYDFIVPVPMAEELTRLIRDAKLEVFEKSGHYTLIEEPDKFYRIVKEFIES